MKTKREVWLGVSRIIRRKPWARKGKKDVHTPQSRCDSSPTLGEQLQPKQQKDKTRERSLQTAKIVYYEKDERNDMPDNER